ncbi:MAG: LptF/LptG family permease [Candidatus Eisenbacteria bacterium]
MRPILSLYILRQHIVPFFFAILVITFLFVMDLLIDYIDLFLGKGVPLPVVLEVFFLSLGWMAALTVPMSALVATVMAFGQLSGDNEITAMKAAGVSIYQVLLPPLLVSLLLAAGLIQFNNRILPESNHRLAGLLVDIHRKRPGLAFKPGVFNDVEGYTLRVEKLDSRTSEIAGVTIQRAEAGEEAETIVAERGRLHFSEDGNTLTLDLSDGEIHAVEEEDPSNYHKISFYTHTIRINNIGSELVRSGKKTRGDRELSAGDMLERVRAYRSEIEDARDETRTAARKHLEARLALLRGADSLVAGSASVPPPLARKNLGREVHAFGNRLASLASTIEDRDKQIDRYMVEVHKKYALPVACVVFVLVGAPLGVKAHRGGLGAGVGFSIVFFVVYYLFLIGGEKLADRGFLRPAIAMWAANVLIGGLGIFLVQRSTRETSFIRFPRLFQSTSGRTR